MIELPKYQILPTKYFVKKKTKLLKNNKPLQDKLFAAITRLSTDPQSSSLKSHKVNSKLFQNVFSSSVTGDIRIIWRYIDNETNDQTIEILEIQILELLDIGGHSGNKGVY